MFVTGQSIYAGMVFSILSFLVAIPSAIKVFNWTATLYKGSISCETPMLYALGFIGLFTIGGLTGLFLATLAIDVHVHDTYFVVAHFHYIMVGGAIMAYLGGLHYWWPKMTGRMYPEGWAKLAALIIFVGFNLTFFPQFLLGYQGMPRRYCEYAPEFQVLNVMSSAGASILAVGYLLPLVYFLWSLRYGREGAGRIPGARPAWSGRRPRRRRRTTSPRRPVVTPPPYVYNRRRPPLSAENIQPGLQPASRPRRPRQQAHTAVEAHATPLAHHFRDLQQQHEVGSLGMWLFLATELLFFGGVLTAFEIYHYKYPNDCLSSSKLL